MSISKLAAVMLWVSMPCIIGFGSLVMKNKVQELESQYKAITRSNEEDIRNIHILKAEWSHLNNPTRLRKLVSKHISLNPIQAEQIINYSELPFSYENGESRKLAARQRISDYAAQNKGLKKLTGVKR